MTYPGKRNSIKHWAEEERPREKLQLKGPSALSDAELLAILIGSGTVRQSALEVARNILNHCNGQLSQLARLSHKQFSGFRGVGPAKAVRIAAALEISRRRHLPEKSRPVKISSSQDAYKFIGPLLRDKLHEEFWILLLNRANQFIRRELISRGGVAGTVVDAKIIFRSALEQLASSVILVHNHPSGNLNPSQADIDVSKKLQEAGRHLDIQVLDHLIISKQGFYSMADEGIL